MTTRDYVRRKFLVYASSIVLVYIVGDLSIHFLTPGSIGFSLAMVTLCLVTLLVIDKVVSIRCPRCGKPLATILFQTAMGWPKQRCPHCELAVDEQMPTDPNTRSG